MGEFIVRKLENYILIEFTDDEHIDRVARLANDLQELNGGKTVVAKSGNDYVILSGDTRLDMDKLEGAFFNVEA